MATTPAARPAPIELSAADARAIALRAQGLDGAAALATPLEVLRHLGAVQLDTISVLARSHELVPYARLGACSRPEIESAYWSTPARAFEYWAHANCVLPIESWPYFAFRRRASHRRWPDTSAAIFSEVRARLRESPLTVSDAGGARDGASGWWNWSAAKQALEVLYRTGEAVVTSRAGWKRIYDTPERAISRKLLRSEPDDRACYRRLVGQAARALGVATERDIATYFMLTTPHAGVAPNARSLLREAIADAGLVTAAVEGWDEPCLVDPALLDAKAVPGSRAVLLSPFDSLIWASPTDAGSLTHGRERARRLFGFFYAFEAYKRPHERLHGYFTMPLLARGRLLGRVDPARAGRTLVARYAALEERSDESTTDMAAALRAAAAWVGCDDVAVERTHPRGLKRELLAALRR